MIVIVSSSQRFDRKHKLINLLMILYLAICNLVATEYDNSSNPSYYLVANSLIVYMIMMFAKINKEQLALINERKMAANCLSQIL